MAEGGVVYPKSALHSPVIIIQIRYSSLNVESHANKWISFNVKCLWFSQKKTPKTLFSFAIFWPDFTQTISDFISNGFLSNLILSVPLLVGREHVYSHPSFTEMRGHLFFSAICLPSVTYLLATAVTEGQSLFQEDEQQVLSVPIKSISFILMQFWKLESYYTKNVETL